MTRVHLTEEKETLLITLYGRALDARSERPVLGDTMAAWAVDEIDYDFGRIRAEFASSAPLRAKFFDGWVREFLAANERATVVHLGVGLDTRVWRIDPGPGVEWYDVDYPEVVELRQQLFPERAGYHQLGSSVTAPEWLEQVPTGRPTLILAEGLSMYLEPDAGHALLRRLTDHFGHGTLMLDVQSRLGIKLVQRSAAVRATGSTLLWGVNSAAELTARNPDLRCVDEVSSLLAAGAEDVSLRHRLAARLLSPIRPLRDIGLYLRFAF